MYFQLYVHNKIFGGSRGHGKVKEKLKLSLCFTKHHAMKTYWGSGGIAPGILWPGTSWRWVVSFMPQLLYLQGKRPWYPLDRRLGGPQSQSGHRVEEKNSQPLSGIDLWSSDVDITEDEISGIGSMHWGGKKCIQKFSQKETTWKT
jgi:hypothetical protein